MNLQDIPKLGLEALACHVVFAGAGIPADNIFIVPNSRMSEDGPPGRVLVLAKQGSRTFAFDVGERGMPEEEFLKLWPEWVKTFKAAPPDDATRWAKGSETWDMASAIFARMLMKGFTLRKELMPQG